MVLQNAWGWVLGSSMVDRQPALRNDRRQPQPQHNHPCHQLAILGRGLNHALVAGAPAPGPAQLWQSHTGLSDHISCRPCFTMAHTQAVMYPAMGAKHATAHQAFLETAKECNGLRTVLMQGDELQSGWVKYGMSGTVGPDGHVSVKSPT